jgi:IS30 family transposase
MTRTRNTSPEEVARRHASIAALTRAGYTAPQIAEALGITTRTVQRARVRTGVAKPFCGIPLSEDEKQRAAEMLDDGASYKEVGRTLGRADTAIGRHFPGRSEWQRGSGHRYRELMDGLDAILPVVLPAGWVWR